MNRRGFGRLLRPLGVRGFRLLFLSTFASSFGTLLAAVALAVDVKDRTNSGPWVAALLVVEFLPTVLVGLLLGPLLDRLSRRGLMIAADVLRAGVFFALPFAAGPGTILGLAAVAGLANGFFRPAALAGVPNLVPEGALPQANSLLVAVENVSWTIGPVVGGVLTAAAGPHAAYWINAVSFAISVALIAQIPRRMLQSAEALSRGHWRDIRDGVAVVRGSRALMTVLVAWSVACLAAGIGNVTEIFLAKDSFHAGDFGFGFIFGAIGFGLVIGSFSSASVQERLGIRVTYAGGLAVLAAGFALAAVSPNVWIAAVCFVVGGVGNGLALSCNPLLVQRGAADEMRGRALTLVMSANFLVMAVGMGLAGPVVERIGARGAIGLAAGVYAFASVVAFMLARGVDRTAAEVTALPQPPGLETASRSTGSSL